MARGYQFHYSDQSAGVFSESGRRRKAATMLAVLQEHIGLDLNTLAVLDIGGSAGIIDDYLSQFFSSVVGIDIDDKAIAHAKQHYSRDNLEFETGDAMNLRFDAGTFDVVICAHIYEHVPDARTMMAEIYRVLKPKGVCYFAAGNRLMWNEPHHNLPLLSAIPRPLAHRYLKLSGKGEHYYEKHLSCRGLRKLVSQFELFDYTGSIINTPEKYHAHYMVKSGTMKHRIARAVAKHLYWLVPGYIWLLRKPEHPRHR